MTQVTGKWVIQKNRFRKNDCIAILSVSFIVAILTLAFYIDRLGSNASSCGNVETEKCQRKSW